MTTKEGLRTAFLISGSATTMEAAVRAVRSGEIDGITPVLVISSRPSALGIEKAQKLGIPNIVTQRKDFKTLAEFGNVLLNILRDFRVDLVSQNGWLPLTPKSVVQEYPERIINQHPGPLDPGRPDFGGQGMYGSRVTAARLAYEWMTEDKDPWTESTVHHVTEEFDKGFVISVKRLSLPKYAKKITIAEIEKHPYQLQATTETIQKSLLPLEHKNVIEVLRSFGAGNFPSFSRQIPLVPKENIEILKQVKELAIKLYPKG